MNLNIFNLIFGVIDIQEPVIEDDDTALFTPVADEPPVLKTHPITLAALIDVSALVGCLAAYRLDSASEWQVGHIRAVEDTRFGWKLLFVPEDARLSEKWRFLNEVHYAWHE